MKKIFKIFLITILFIISTKQTLANNFYEFENFLSDIETIKNANININKIKYIEQVENLKKNKCNIQNYWEYSFIAPVCLLNKQNYLTPKEALRYLTNNLNSYDNEYQQDSYQFIYHPIQPNFKYSLYDKYLEYKWTTYEILALLYLTNENQMIKINNNILSRLMFEDYTFYSVPTNLSNRWPCSLTNYKIAISKIDWMELKPWEILNLNKLISNDPHSCKWNSTKSFLFYWWSCGASSQLFRLSLIMPNITVLERAWHSKRRALYYGSNIMWDDAAMYENSEKFIIRNDFNTSIYFVAYEKNNYVHLIWVVPEKVDEYVEIIKKVNWYHSSVFKQIYNKQWIIIWTNQFDSVYSSLYRWKS